MISREILQYPDPRLKSISEDVSLSDNSSLEITVEKLRKVLQKNPGVGIAAIQLGIPEKIFIVNSSYNKKLGQNSSGEMVFINPEIISKQGKQLFREGCLSVADYTADIQRAQQITVRYLNNRLEIEERTFKGFEAVIIQHEYDHLIGKLFLDRVLSPKNIYLRK